MTSKSSIVIGSHVRRNLGIGRQCTGCRSPGSTCSAGKAREALLHWIIGAPARWCRLDWGACQLGAESRVLKGCKRN
jgi:hypothetical protein